MNLRLWFWFTVWIFTDSYWRTECRRCLAGLLLCFFNRRVVFENPKSFKTKLQPMTSVFWLFRHLLTPERFCLISVFRFVVWAVRRLFVLLIRIIPVTVVTFDHFRDRSLFLRLFYFSRSMCFCCVMWINISPGILNWKWTMVRCSVVAVLSKWPRNSVCVGMKIC